MAAFGFSFNDVNPVHRGLDQWYKIDWTMPDAETSDYPFIRFKIQNGLSFS